MSSVVPADDNTGTDGSSCKEHNDHIDDTGGGTDGGEGVGADEISDDKTVHGVVELLKEVSDYKRNRKHEQELRDRTRCHVHGLLLFLILIHMLSPGQPFSEDKWNAEIQDLQKDRTAADTKE